MAIAESILFEINSTNYNNSDVFLMYKPQSGCSGFITTLRITVNLKSISEANFPYISDETPPDVLEKLLEEVALNTPFKEVFLYFKKGTGSWVKRASIKIFNKDPYYDVNLIRMFSDSNTIDVAEDFSLGIKLKVGDVLTSADTILVWGAAVEEKKNNGNEELAARIEALELALAGRLTAVPANTLLGRGASSGVVEAIPATNFVTPVQSQSAIEQAIFDLAGAAPTALNTLAELAAAFGNDPNFASTITALIATKAVLNVSLQLTPRSNTTTGPFDANNWVLTFFAGIKWLDGGATNLGLPPNLNTGMILQFDPLHLSIGVARKYLVQIFFSGTRLFFRIQNNEIWGQWREIATSVAV